MKCTNCGQENMEGSNFCIQCGTRLEKPQEAEFILIEEETQEGSGSENADSAKEASPKEAETSASFPDKEEQPAEMVLDLDKEELSEPAPASQPEKIWFCVLDGDSAGPYDEEDIAKMLERSILDSQSYVWKSGMDNWTPLKQTRLAYLADEAKSVQEASAPDFASQASSLQEPAAETAPAKEAWFYVKSSRSTGPYAAEVMGQMIQSGLIDGSTFVWKEGMGDWARLQDTSLAKYLSQKTAGSDYTQQAYRQPYREPERFSSAKVPVQEHSVVLYILLSICTCGIWYLVWLYQLARDVNILTEEQNSPKGTDPVLTLILCLLSCSIYQLYFFWKDGDALSRLRYPNYRVDNQGTVMAVLALFFPIASAAIMQDQINSILKYGRR